MMLSRLALRQTTRCYTAPRAFTTVAQASSTADDALKFSGYQSIDFTIKEDLPTYEAVQKFAAFNIGCLVTTDAAGKLVTAWVVASCSSSSQGEKPESRQYSVWIEAMALFAPVIRRL